MKLQDQKCNHCPKGCENQPLYSCDACWKTVCDEHSRTIQIGATELHYCLSPTNGACELRIRMVVSDCDAMVRLAVQKFRDSKI